jgi:hypothetical protein
MTTKFVPGIAVGAMLIAKVDEALPPGGMWRGSGSKLDTVTPGGRLVAVNVTSPTYLDTEVPVTVMGADVPCAEARIEEETLRA